MSAAEPGDDEDSGESIPATRALVPSAVDRSLRFVPHREGGLGRLVTWNAVGLGLLVSAPFGPAAWGLVGALGGVGTIAYGWLSTLTRGQLADRILRARAHLRSSPAEAVAALEGLAAAALPAPHRLEAAGHAALLALERGEVSRAIELVAFDTRDDGPGPRARGLERGLVGELARSVLAWLSPGAFERVAHSSAFELDPSQREGLARPGDIDEFLDLVGLLRVLEATAASGSEQALLAWRQCRDSGLSRRFPGLFMLARAAAARRLPSIRDELEADLQSRPDARRFLERVFPEFARAGGPESIYREAAPPIDGGDEADRALARVSAPEAVSLAARQVAGPLEYRRATSDVIRRWLMLGAGATAGVILLGAAVGGAIGAWTVSMFAAYIGAPLAVIGSIRGMRASKARLRLAPLWRLRQRPPIEWLAEFERSPNVRGSASSLQTEDMLVYVACVQAEQELAAGRAFAAWSCVEWYFRGFAADRVELGVLYPVGASLVRIAALTGHLVEARRVSDALASARPSRDRRGRTAYGTAPRALALARALLLARSGEWTKVPTQLSLARRLPDVWMAERDQALYDLVVLVARARTREPLEAPDSALVERHTEWFSQVAPELLEDLGSAA